MRAGRIDWAEESVGRLRLQADHVSSGTFFQKLVALAEDGLDSMPAWLAVFAGEAVELRRRELDGGREQRNHDAFCQNLRREGKVMGQEPARQLRLVVGARPTIVLEPLINPEANVS